MVQIRVKFSVATTANNVLNFAHFYNPKLRVFLMKNTISCGGFSLPTKPVVDAKNRHPTHL